MSEPLVHLLAHRNARTNLNVSRCGEPVTFGFTAWRSDATCEACLSPTNPFPQAPKETRR